MTDVPLDVRRARERWRYRGDVRPDFAIEPAESQESVWDYPRPPRVDSDPRRVQVIWGETIVADTDRAYRVLETASPPVFYLPPEDIRMEFLKPAPGDTHCEWKGRAGYWALQVGGARTDRAAWSYADPYPGYEMIAGYLSFYPAKVECRVEGRSVAPQPGDFYGGWVTAEIVGPFKGAPGSEWW
jgi:uncharacterized protein (DUF427 family)